MNEEAKTLMDAVSVATVVGTLAGILPAIAALVTIIWTGIRIWESETVQSFFRRRG